MNYIWYGIYEMRCVFYIPESLQDEFHKYHLKWKLISDSFDHNAKLAKIKENQNRKRKKNQFNSS